MNATQALTKLRKLLGPKAGIQDDKRPSSPELREAAAIERRAAKERKGTCEELLNARRKEILAADVEYQRLRAEFDVARIALEKAPWPHYYRYTAGTVSSLFFSVRCQADTLAELVAEVEKKQRKEAA